MKRIFGLTVVEIIFIVICLSLVFLTNFKQSLICLLMLVILLVFQKFLSSEERAFKYDKKFLYGFGIVFIFYMAIQLYFSIRYENLVEVFNLNEIRLYYQLPILLTLLLAYTFKVRYRRFNWSITIKEVLFILLLFVPLLIEHDFSDFMARNVDFFYIRNYFQQLYYPSIVEEVMFRGLLLTGLISIHVREDKANIIQAVVFGLIHLINFPEINVIALILISLQTFIGYIFGKLYLKTKSLMPGILLHALIDTI